MNGFQIEDVTARFDARDIEANKAVAGLTGFPILFWLPFAAAKDSAFAKFFSNQSLMLLIVSAINVLIRKIWLVGGILAWIIGLAVTVCAILLVISGFQGRARKLPFIGDIEIIK